MSEAAWNSLINATIAICWSVFAVVWIVGHVYNKRHSPAVTRRTLGNTRWLVMGAAVVILLRFVPPTDWQDLSVHSAWLRWPGLVLLVGSTVFTLWARITLGLMWSSDVVARSGHELRTDGPYAVVRHPIYAGLLGMLIGSALLEGFGRWTVGLVVAAVLIAIKTRAEERLMTEEFPSEYPRYRRRVPALVPVPRRR